MKNIYKNIYSRNKNLGQLADNPRIKIMVEIVNRLNLLNKNILDIGCYDGTFLSLISNKNNDFYGVEASDWGVEQAKKKRIKVEQFFFNDQDQFPFSDNFFEAIIAGEIIEHVYDTDFFLAEINRLLKPGGQLIISTPNIASLGRRAMLIFGCNPILECSPNEKDSSGHIRYFTFHSLQKMLEKHNFKVILSQSDCVNFSHQGQLKSPLLAKLFPRLGASIIYLVEKK